MASTNSNKGRAVVLSAACVTMFFISSIALYSVVSKNLLAVYPEWSSALTWAFPVFQTIMAVTGIFAGRISDKIGPRNVVIAAAVCYGLGWFMSGTVTEPWQFYCGSRSSPPSATAWLQPGAHHRPKVVHRQEGPRLRHHPGRFDRRPRRAVPGARLAAHPSLGIFGALKALGVIFFVMIAASALFLKAPEAGWLPEASRPPRVAHMPAPSATSPRARWSRPAFLGPHHHLRLRRHRGHLLVGKVASIAAVQLFADPTSAAAVALGGVVVSVNTCANLVGRLSFGQIIDKLGAYKSLLISLVVTIVALVIMSMSFTQAMFFVALALLGFSFGACSSSTAAHRWRFGTSNIGVNYGIMFLGYAASTWISQPSPPCCITPRLAAPPTSSPSTAPS